MKASDKHLSDAERTTHPPAPSPDALHMAPVLDGYLEFWVGVSVWDAGVGVHGLGVSLSSYTSILGDM